MKSKKVLWSILTVIMLLSMTVGSALADDGEMFRKNVSKTPDQETERANINHMSFYVPAQAADGTQVTITYEYLDATLNEDRDYAKPLVAVYIDALPEEETKSGAGFGAHDAYAAVSLDDGATWKSTNLSGSAHLSSFTLANGEPYPGDAHNMTFAIAGDKVLVGWISKYCDGGSPAYTMVDTEGKSIYPDLWGVSGSQGSVDYELQGFPEVGEIPYSCVWAARGTLLPLGDYPEDGYDIIWTKAERLTSGRRDANRLEMAGDSAGGFMMTWQEDPEGLRPGQGLGPGEGWSGAVVNGQTDLWYSYISNADFEMVKTSDDTFVPVSIYEYDITGEMPKVAIPMALPIRLTDNAMCKISGSQPYCYMNFDDVDAVGNLIIPDPLPTVMPIDGSATFCADTVSWLSPGGSTLDLCIAKDGRVMQGRVGASRPRVNVQPFDSDGDGLYDNAFVIMGAEESKALGEGAPDDPGAGQPEEEEPPDIGKNMWYYSFDMLNPSFVMQGGILNHAAKCSPYDVTEKGCTLGEIMLLDDPIYLDNIFYETEIARRFSHMSQPIHQIGPSGVSSVLIVKQGILNQGGPADIFLRLTKVPDVDWIKSGCADPDGEGPLLAPDRCLPAGYNPYAYKNMVCEDDDANEDDGWAFRDGTNPRYVEGICLTTGINVSGTTIVSCDAGTPEQCVANFPWDGGVTPFPKVTEWRQCDGESTLGEFICTDDDLDDESWENPFDVAKGHRGFIDGDFIMMMYAWSPNWKANSVGNDHYNLYARRSFDGGETWTTLPDSFVYDGVAYKGEGEDQTTVPDVTACENYGAGTGYTTVCFDYGPGDFEQARNLSQLTGNKVTILDPRYTPTGGIKMLPIWDKYGLNETDDLPYANDRVRDPSKYFIVYETGDNTTVAEGEAVPMDLFYSRATQFGDDYLLVEYPTGDGTSWGFPWLENKSDDLSGEAANTSDPSGDFYYVIWNQWQEDEFENVSESDAIFRRVMFNDLLDRTTLNLIPVASILATEQEVFGVEEDQIITLIASARDLDIINDETLDPIQEYIWTINGVAIPEEYQDAFKDMGFDCFKDKQCNAPARVVSGHWDGYQFQQPGWSGQSNYQYGWYEFALQVRDNDDPAKWSKIVKVKKYIGQTQNDVPFVGFKIFLPLTTK